MAYGVRNLRPQSVFGGFGDFDQITPDYGYQDNDNPIMDPIGQQEPAPYDPYNRQSEVETARTPSTPEPQTIEAPKVDPNSGMTLQDWFKAINEGYTPQTYARDRFNTQIDQFPERRQPSGAMRWAAGLQGISQVGRQGGNPAKTVDDILSSEGNRAIDDWKTRIDPYHKAATLEGSANVQERTLAGNAVTGYMNDQRVREAARKADMQNEVAALRARAYAAKQNGLEIIKSGSRLIGVDNNGNTRDLGPSGLMDREEEINLLGKWREKAAAASGAAAIERAQATGGGIVVVDGVPYEKNTTTNRWEPAAGLPTPKGNQPPGISRPTTGGGGRTGGGKQTSQLEKRRIESDENKNEWLSKPETRKYINREGNEYVRKPRPQLREDTWYNPFDKAVTEEDVRKYDEYWSSRDPNYKPSTSGSAPPPPSGATPSATPSARPSTSRGGRGMFDQDSGVDDGGEDPRGYSKNAAPPPAGTIRMRAPDGSIRHVPAGRVAEAEKNGMRRLR